MMGVRGWQPVAIVVVLVLSAAGAGVVLEAGIGGGASAEPVDDTSMESALAEESADTRSAEQSRSDGPITDVEILETNSPVYSGFNLHVEFRVNGSVANETARLIIDNETLNTMRYGSIDQRSVHSFGVVRTEDITPGTHELSVRVGNVSDTVEVTILERPENPRFDVVISRLDEPVTAGELFVVDYEAENVGLENGTQTVSLVIDNVTVDTDTVTLTPERTAFRKLVYRTEANDTGRLNVSVRTENASASRVVNVTGPEPASPPRFTFSIGKPFSVSPVAAGETVYTYGFVQNHGGQAGIETLRLEVNGRTVDTDTVTLRPDGEETYALEYETRRDDIGILRPTTIGSNVTNTQTLSVIDPSVSEFFMINVSEQLGPLEAGEELEVLASGVNVGRDNGFQTITLEVGNRTVDTASVPVRSGSPYESTLTYQTGVNETGELNITVRSENSSASRTVTVTEPDETGNESEDADEVIHWQVDFGAGSQPPDPPSYWPRDLLAALGNSEDGVTQNPSVYQARNESQLGGVNIVDEGFEFDDEGDPTEVTVEFEVEENTEPREFHLAVYTLPGPFTMDEIDQQKQFASVNASYEAGETGELTVPIPQPSEVPDIRTAAVDSVDQLSPVTRGGTRSVPGRSVSVPLDLLV